MFLDIKARHGSNINATRLAALRTSKTNIEHRISTEFEPIGEKDDVDWTSPVPQPVEVSTTDNTPPTTKPTPEIPEPGNTSTHNKSDLQGRIHTTNKPDRSLVETKDDTDWMPSDPQLVRVPVQNTTQPDINLAGPKDDADWTTPAHQLMKVPAPDTAPPSNGSQLHQHHGCPPLLWTPAPSTPRLSPPMDSFLPTSVQATTRTTTYT